MAKAKLSKSFIDNLPFVKDGKRQFYHDTSLKGFMLIVGKTAKTYAAQSSIRGKSVRYTIGKHGLYTLDQARRIAHEKLILFSNNIHPNQKEKVTRPL